MNDLIIKWKLNRGLLASKIGMPKGTFNNKLNPNHFTKFNDKELESLKVVLIELRNEMEFIDEIGFNEALKIITQKNI